jgi:hypothetical protein
MTGFGSLRQKTYPRLIFGWCLGRNHLVWHEPITMANDRRKMFCWCICWYCGHSPRYAQREQYQVYASTSIQLLCFCPELRIILRSLTWSVLRLICTVYLLTGRSGGVLERPAAKYTSTFGRVQFFHDYPYALPGMVTSAIALSAAMTTFFFVKEVCKLLVISGDFTEYRRHYTLMVTKRRPATLPCRSGNSSTTLASHESCSSTTMS